MNRIMIFSLMLLISSLPFLKIFCQSHDEMWQRYQFNQQQHAERTMLNAQLLDNSRHIETINYNNDASTNGYSQEMVNLFSQAEEKFGKGNYEGAIEDFSNIIRKNFASLYYTFEAYFQRAFTKEIIKDYKGAIEDYSMAIRMYSGCSNAYNNRGLIKGKLHDTKGEIADYNKAIEIDPKNNYPYRNRAVVKYIDGDYQEAIADYTKAIKIYNKIPGDYFGRGLAKQQIKDYEGAIADYSQAIKIGPSALAYNQRGMVRYYKNDFKGAIIDYTKAIKFTPKDEVVYYNRANVKDEVIYYNRAKTREEILDYSEAFADCNKAIEINPKYADAYIERGILKNKLGQKDSGCLDLRKAEELGSSYVTDAIKKYCQ